MMMDKGWMRRIGLAVTAVCVGILLAAGDASAWRGHYRSYHHHRGGSRVFFHLGFYSYPFYPVYYYPPVYAYPAYPVYGYAPAPVYAYPAGGNEFLGSILGAIGGGVIGNQIGAGAGRAAATVAGALIGTLVGGEVGRQLDQRDQLLLARARYQALETSPSGGGYNWRNPDTGHTGSVTPQPAFKNAAGQYCREFQQTVTVGGQEQSAYGTACRQPDGSWQVTR